MKSVSLRVIHNTYRYSGETNNSEEYSRIINCELANRQYFSASDAVKTENRTQNIQEPTQNPEKFVLYIESV